MFKDQVIWITGASSGIGEALALEFAKRGAKLIFVVKKRRLTARCSEKVRSHWSRLSCPLCVTDGCYR